MSLCLFFLGLWVSLVKLEHAERQLWGVFMIEKQLFNFINEKSFFIASFNRSDCQMREFKSVCGARG